MKKFKVVLADDEPQILRGMKDGVDWLKLGFEIVGACDNGQEALEQVKALQADVLISDIKMPFMDGLEAAKAIAQDYLDVKVVLISGFDEFEYAQKAISYGVSEYLLKPVTGNQIEELMAKIYHELIEAQKEALNQQRLEEIYQQSFPILKQKVLKDILKDRIDFNEALNLASKYDLKIPGPLYCVLELQLESEVGITQVDQMAIIATLMKDINLICSYEICDFFERPAIIISLSGKERIGNILKYLIHGGARIGKIADIQVFGGIGHIYDRIEGISQSYRDSNRALDYSLVTKDCNFMYINDIEKIKPSHFAYDSRQIQNLLQSIKTGDAKIVKMEVRCIFDHLQSNCQTLSQYQNYSLKVAYAIDKAVNDFQLAEALPIFTPENIQAIVATTAKGALEELLAGLCCEVQVLIKQKLTDTNKLLAIQAKEYIDDNYQRTSLDVEDICEFLNISPSHFSNIFKKEFGINFIHYLSEKRIGAAKELLVATDVKTREIGRLVGYQEPNYFSYVFKKWTGESPIMYRKRVRQ